MNRPTRRRLLAAVGLSLGVSSAGCSSGGDSGDSTTTDESTTAGDGSTTTTGTAPETTTTTTEPTTTTTETTTTTTTTETTTTTTTETTTTTPIPEGDHRVDMTDSLRYEPERIQADPGDTVVWANVGSLSHTVTAYGDELPDGAAYFASGGYGSESEAREAYPDGSVPPDTAFVHTFETEGTYEYFCIPHESSGMQGVVEVGDQPAAGATVELSDSLEFSPGELEVTAGTTVEWDNVGNLAHTVTAYGDSVPADAEYFASGGFDSESAARDGYPDGAIAGGESFTHTFETAGTYEYFCIPHEGAGMTGTIRVV